MRQRAAASGGRDRRGEAGFSMIQIVIVSAIIAITVTFAFIGIANARASYRVQNSARIFAGHLERARTDAIRRHATTRVRTLTSNATSYEVTMDTDGNGTVETRTYQVETGVEFLSDPLDFQFNWRGRLSGAGASFAFRQISGTYIVQIDVTGSGDITIGDEVFPDSAIPPVVLRNTTVGGSTDVSSGFTGTSTSPPSPPAPPTTTPPPPGGTTPPPPGGTTPPAPPTTTPPAPPTTTPPAPPPTTQPPSPSPPPTQPPAPPPPTTTPPPPPAAACTITATPANVSFRACNNGGNNCGNSTVTVTLTNAAAGSTVSVTNPSNAAVTLLSSSNGTFTYKIQANTNARTTSTAKFTNTCGVANVGVTTTN